MNTRNENAKEPMSPIRETDDPSRRMAKDLIRKARFGALAAIEAGTGHPLASRVALATDLDGTPIGVPSRSVASATRLASG
ncbi:MAG: hypothetical protein AAFY05_21075 [Pseudomonadota bacterium]